MPIYFLLFYQVNSERNINSGVFYYSEAKGKSRLIREEDHDRSDDDSQDRLDMLVSTEARDKEKRREAIFASQVTKNCEWILLYSESREPIFSKTSINNHNFCKVLIDYHSFFICRFR